MSDNFLRKSQQKKFKTSKSFLNNNENKSYINNDSPKNKQKVNDAISKHKKKLKIISKKSSLKNLNENYKKSQNNSLYENINNLKSSNPKKISYTLNSFEINENKKINKKKSRSKNFLSSENKFIFKVKKYNNEYNECDGNKVSGSQTRYFIKESKIHRRVKTENSGNLKNFIRWGSRSFFNEKMQELIKKRRMFINDTKNTNVSKKSKDFNKKKFFFKKNEKFKLAKKFEKKNLNKKKKISRSLDNNFRQKIINDRNHKILHSLINGNKEIFKGFKLNSGFHVKMK